MNPWRELRALPKEVWFLCLAILINRAGTMVLPFLTLYLILDRQWPAGTAGFALTIYGSAAIIIAPISGRLSDRFGALPIIRLSLLSNGLILFGFLFVQSLVGIFIITALWAIANEAFRPPSMAVIGELAGPTHRKSAFALARLAINLGMSIGPVVGGYLAMRSFKLLFVVDGATALLAALLLVLVPWRSSPETVETSRSDLKTLETPETLASTSSLPVSYSNVLKDRRFIYFLAAMFPIQLVFFQSLAAMPLFLVRDLRMTEASFGLLLAINTVIIILIEVPLNSMMSHWRHSRALALGAILVGIGFGALALVDSVPKAAITVVIWTFGEMIFLPASSAYVSDIAPREQAGAYMGLYTMGFSLALATGPWLGTQILQQFQPGAVWVATFGCGCVSAMMMWFLRDSITKRTDQNA